MKKILNIPRWYIEREREREGGIFSIFNKVLILVSIL